MKTNLLLALPFLIAALISCEPEQGTKVIELTLDTVPFDRIRLASSADVRIIQSDIFQVVIDGRQKDVDDIDVNVIDERLGIDEKGHHPGDLVIKIFLPFIRDLESSGSSFIYGESNFHQDRNMNISLEGSGQLDFAVETNNLDLELTGSASASLEGKVSNVAVDITGSGWLKSFKLDSDISNVRITGSGSAEVSVNDVLSASILGSGDVFYKGHPKIFADITGSGKVINAN
ncbi:MAG: head GIN domain-containing protein [Saprospiraceae bacterium]